MTSGQHKMSVKFEGVTCNQQPGCSIAIGVIYSTATINEGSTNGHWSVAYGHSTGIEYLGNKWGTGYGARLANDKVITIYVDMDARTLSFDYDGTAQGQRSSSLPAAGVQFAVSIENNGGKAVIVG